MNGIGYIDGVVIQGGPSKLAYTQQQNGSITIQKGGLLIRGGYMQCFRNGLIEISQSQGMLGIWNSPSVGLIIDANGEVYVGNAAAVIMGSGHTTLACTVGGGRKAVRA